MSVSLIDLHFSRLATWPDARLRIWCEMVPRILLCALRVGGHEPSQEGMPRPKGAYTSAQLDEVQVLRVTMQCQECPAHWREHGRWALAALYPEYRRRFGKPHGSEARTLWIGRTHASTADAVLCHDNPATVAA
jgi:hypothetical protein